MNCKCEAKGFLFGKFLVFTAKIAHFHAQFWNLGTNSMTTIAKIHCARCAMACFPPLLGTQ